MKVTLGKEGLTKSWQADFPEVVPCVHCSGEARVAFVAHEGIDDDDSGVSGSTRVYGLHPNEGKGSYWLHDCCTVAVYFCRECLEPTALYNQA